MIALVLSIAWSLKSIQYESEKYTHIFSILKVIKQATLRNNEMKAVLYGQSFLTEMPFYILRNFIGERTFVSPSLISETKQVK